MLALSVHIISVPRNQCNLEFVLYQTRLCNYLNIGHTVPRLLCNLWIPSLCSTISRLHIRYSVKQIHWQTMYFILPSFGPVSCSEWSLTGCLNASAMMSCNVIGQINWITNNIYILYSIVCTTWCYELIMLQAKPLEMHLAIILTEPLKLIALHVLRPPPALLYYRSRCEG